MTKKLEEVFGMIPEEDDESIVNDVLDAYNDDRLASKHDLEDRTPEQTPTIEESKSMMAVIEESMSETDKIDSALPSVSDLNEHDGDMDEIHKKAMDTFNDLVDLGMNVEVHAGAKLFETANQMLKTAMEAKDSKVDRKLRMISLQLQKARLDHAIEKEEAKQKSLEGDEIETEGKVTIDRNELLKRIAKAKNLKGE